MLHLVVSQPVVSASNSQQARANIPKPPINFTSHSLIYINFLACLTFTQYIAFLSTFMISSTVFLCFDTIYHHPNGIPPNVKFQIAKTILFRDCNVCLFFLNSGTVQYIRLLGCRCPVRVLVPACLVYQQTTQPPYLAVTRTTGRISVRLQPYPLTHASYVSHAIRLGH